MLTNACGRLYYLIEKYRKGVMIVGRNHSKIELDVHLVEADGRLRLADVIQKIVNDSLTGNDVGGVMGSHRQELEKNLDGHLSTMKNLENFQEFEDTITPFTPDQVKLEEFIERISVPVKAIQKLSLVGRIPIGLSFDIIGKCRSMTVVHFHLSTFLGIDPTFPLRLNLTFLKTLIIDSLGFRHYVRTLPSNQRNPLPTVANFLQQNHFPFLQELILDVPYCVANEEMMLTTLTAFLNLHKGILRSFCYHQGFHFNSSANQEQEPDISLAVMAAAAMKLKPIMHLQEFHIGLDVPQESEPVWTNFMLQQVALEKLIFTGEYILFPFYTVQRNAATLTTLILQVMYNVDCSSMKHCSQLRKLTLLGTQSEDWNQGDDDGTAEQLFQNDNAWKDVNILNVKDLPSSLEKIRINSLRIDTQSATYMICSGRLSNLKELELIDCGVEGILGVSLPAIGYILQHKHLQRFQIDYSLNRKSLEVRSLPPELAMLAFAIQNNTVSGFVIQGRLNGSGAYEIPCDDWMAPCPDLFEFPDEISPTGFLKKSMDMQDAEQLRIQNQNYQESGTEEQSSVYDTTAEESDLDAASSYTDATTDEGGGGDGDSSFNHP